MKLLMPVISAQVPLLWYAYHQINYFFKLVQSERNVLRILISSFGSPLWSKEYKNPVLLSQFLHSLRASVRGAYAAAVVTVPNHLLQVVHGGSIVWRVNLCV